MFFPEYICQDDFSPYRNLFIQSPHHRCSYKNGEEICPQGKIWPWVMYIEIGSVDLFIKKDNCKIIVQTYKENSIIPFIPYKEMELSYISGYTASDDTKIIKVSKKDFESFLAEDTNLKEELSKSYIKLVYLLMHLLSAHALDTGLERISSILYYNFNKQKDLRSPYITMRQKRLEALTGLNRTNLSKYMNILKKEHVIEYNHNHIKLLDEQKLKEYCSSNLKNCSLQMVPNCIPEAAVSCQIQAVQNLKNYIQKNYKFPDDIKKYKEELINKNKNIFDKKNTLEKVFKKQMNHSINAYINIIRINKACLLLNSTKLTVLDVALESGFESLSSFYSLFKAETGLTPTEWKKNKKLRR